MKKHELVTSFLIPLVEVSGIIGIFFVAYSLRQITDGIPFIQLPIPYISPDQFFPFILSGAFFWWILFTHAGLYRYESERPLFDIIREVIVRGLIWFFFYISFVYLSLGFIFTKEIPRLIILYVWIGATMFSILLRVCIYTLMGILFKKGLLEKNHILVVDESEVSHFTPENNNTSEYITLSKNNFQKIEQHIRSGKIDTLFMLAKLSGKEIEKIISLCAIYGVRYSYPKIPDSVSHMSRNDRFIGGIPVIESSALAMSVWDRIMKRIVDIILSILGLVLLLPLLVLIASLIKMEDPSGPVIFRNRRVGEGGKEFFLYKFRYMYWKYSVKDAYGIDKKDDSALQYEEELKKNSDTRKGPLYKIAEDPRKTRIGKWIEKLSLDELPQLWNVLLGDMSLVGPRPHQPREVEHYDEHHYQVLTVKPGITGMGQVSGREKNSFDEEVAYDVYYIEHYSLLLDMLILGKTFFVVAKRVLR